MASFVFFGIGSSLLVDYIETSRRLSWEIAAGILNREGPDHLGGAAPKIRVQDVTAAVSALPFICPLFTPANRHTAVGEALRAGFRNQLPLVDPTAIVASDLRIGGGSYVNAGAIIAASANIGPNVVINRGASIGHHARLAEYVSIGPSAVLAGHITVGRGTMIGAGAVITPEVTIGDYAIVGAGSVVTRDVPARTKVLGSPAKPAGEPLASFPDP